MYPDLYSAVWYGTLQDIKETLALGGDIHCTDGENTGEYNTHTLMHAAAERSYKSKEEALAIIGYLKDQGLDINAIYLIPNEDHTVSCKQETPLIRATHSLKYKEHNKKTAADYYAIDALLELGADVNKGYTERGKSLFHYAIDGLDDQTLAKKLLNRGVNPFRYDGISWRPGSLYKIEKPSYDLDKELSAIVKEAETQATKAGLQFVAYNADEVTEPSIWPWLLEFHREVTLALKELITKALLCNEDDPHGFTQSCGRTYSTYPMSLTTTKNQLHEKEIYLERFGNEKQQIHAVRAILKQIIQELGSKPNLSGGTNDYTIKFGRQDISYDANNITFTIDSEIVVDIRRTQKMANPGYASLTEAMIGAFYGYGMQVAGEAYKETGKILPTNSSNFSIWASANTTPTDVAEQRLQKSPKTR